MVLFHKDLREATIEKSIAKFPELIEARLFAACHLVGDEASPCLHAASVHFSAGGGRVRAHICFDAGIRLGLQEADALCLATVCELLHNASLIQDDLMDRTTLRRGSPSVWVSHGDTSAICTGDLMLSAAYATLADISQATLLGPAIRLVHRRTAEVILGQAIEDQQVGQQSVGPFYEQQAKGKSASLLSLALELPLLFSGYAESLATAHSVASHFAVAYQVADDLDDCTQDFEAGTPNILHLLMQQDGLTMQQARGRAIDTAFKHLASAEADAERLPSGCADRLLQRATAMRDLIAGSMTPLSVTAGK